MLNRWRLRRRDAVITTVPLVESPADPPHEQARGATRRQVEELARRAGELELPADQVLGADSPWRAQSRRIGELRRAEAHYDDTRATRERAATEAAARVGLAAARDRELRAAGRAEEAEARAVRIAGEAERLRAERVALAPERRSHRLLPLWVLLSGAAFVGTDVLILHFTLALSPGDDRLHWLTAVAVGLGLLAFAHASGWLWAMAFSIGRRSWAWRGGLALVGGVVSCLALIAFVALQQFRAQALMSMAAQDGVPVVDPRFFFFIQVVAYVAAVIYALRWYLADDERRVRGTERRLEVRAWQARRGVVEARRHVEAATNERVSHEQQVERLRSQLAAETELAAAAAVTELAHAQLLEELYEPEYRLSVAQRRRDVARSDAERAEAERAAERVEAERRAADARAQANREAVESHARMSWECEVEKARIEAASERDAADRADRADREGSERDDQRRRERVDRRATASAARRKRRAEARRSLSPTAIAGLGAGFVGALAGLPTDTATLAAAGAGVMAASATIARSAGASTDAPRQGAMSSMTMPLNGDTPPDGTPHVDGSTQTPEKAQ